MASSNNVTTDWNITTDIYSIVDSIENVKKRYIEDEDETTLALGIYGFITDTEAKKIQTSTIMAGELGNEMFPTRAKLTKNVLAHAIYNNIGDINAIPAHIVLNIGIKVEDLNNYMVNNRFTFDRECPIFIGTYEFHFDYNIIITRSSVNTDIYSAHYDMTTENRLSNIINPYLKQPFLIQIGNDLYLIFQAMVRQITIETIHDKFVSDSIIDNKTYTFDFSNQLSDFDVIINDNGVETTLTPVLYGSNADDLTNYCWYLFISDNTVRITFDSKSYTPGLNSDITIKAYTTLGSKGIFSYKKIDESSEGLFVDFNSTAFNYSKITCYVVAVTNSVDGADKKSKEELQRLIPKAAMSRGNITAEIDLQNYFNLIDTEEQRMVLQKKIDNQLARVWYGYFLLKDENNNIIPTNTIPIQVYTTDSQVFLGEDGRYVVPSGTLFKYKQGGYATIIDESAIPELYSDNYFDGEYYYYMSVHNIIISPDPVYAAFYLTSMNKDSYFVFKYVNEATEVQFISNSTNFQRSLLTDNPLYKLTFSLAQSIAVDFGLYKEESVERIDAQGNTVRETVITNNIKAIVVFYKENIPYRWAEAELKSASLTDYVYNWELELETDNGLDDRNRIKILDLHVAGSSTDINYGYMEPNTKTVLYTLAKFDREYGRYDLDNIAPGFSGYSVTNVYELNDGIDFYENFTNMTNTKVSKESDVLYYISGVPMVGVHYVLDEEKADFLTDAIFERKAYIEYCLTLLDNNMDIDFKFFNTYGPSVTYTIGDKQETPIGHVDISMKFRASLRSSSDVYTKEDLIQEIKAYIEDLYETGDLHIPNLIKDLSNKFESRCNYIEFMNFNDFWLGVQHIIKREVTDPHVVPEFINIRNVYDETGNLVPDIEIEVLY